MKKILLFFILLTNVALANENESSFRLNCMVNSVQDISNQSIYEIRYSTLNEPDLGELFKKKMKLVQSPKDKKEIVDLKLPVGEEFYSIALPKGEYNFQLRFSFCRIYCDVYDADNPNRCIDWECAEMEKTEFCSERP